MQKQIESGGHFLESSKEESAGKLIISIGTIYG